MSASPQGLRATSPGGQAIGTLQATETEADPFDNPDFNAAHYVNEIFPDGMFSAEVITHPCAP